MGPHHAGDRETLPKNTRPELYSIQLEPNFETFTYQGYETVLISILENTSSLVLNSKCIKILSAKLSITAEEELPATSIDFDVEKETVTIGFGQELQGNTKSTLHISFLGILNDELCGFYRSRMRSGERDEYMAITHFEASNARRAFPCWDEPALKACFVISLVVDEDMVGLSNAHVVRESVCTSPFASANDLTLPDVKDSHRKKIVIFAPTPLMSTYLVAFAVGKFSYVEAFTSAPALNENPATSLDSMKSDLSSTLHSDSNLASSGGSTLSPPISHDLESGSTLQIHTPPESGSSASSVSESSSSNALLNISDRCIRCRVYCPPEKVEMGRYALEVATKALVFFEETFGENYPLEKLDMISVVDYEIGAMENWGLVTFREMSLLIEENGEASRKERIAGTVCHELAHMWFGNLVTMEWWQDLWLKEGFATWAGNTAVDYIYPHWDVWAKFVASDTQHGMKLDSLLSTHPIEVPVRNPAEITQIFDAISYCKGASVIRMLSSWLGYKKFCRGIKIYLKVHRLGNATTEDLWQCLTQAADVDVSGFMNEWTRAAGLPVLTVKETVGKNGKNQLSIQQERFLSSGPMDQDGVSNIWSIPLYMADVGDVTGRRTARFAADEASKVNPDLLLSEVDGVFDRPATSAYLINKGRAGFYRVNYPPENVRRLAALIEENAIRSSVDRVGLLMDTGALAIAGYTNVVAILEFCTKFKAEKEFIVWSEVDTQLHTIESCWFDNDYTVQKPMDAIRRQLFSEQAARLGWDYHPEENHLTAQLRTLVISAAGHAGDKMILKEVRELFRKYVFELDKKCMHSNIRGTVFSIAVHHGGEGEFDAVLDLFRTSRDSEERFSALRAASYTLRPELLDQVLNLLVSEEVGPSEMAFIYAGLASSAIGRRKFWNFLKRHWNALQDRLTSNRSLLGGLVLAATKFSSDAHAQEIESFFSDKKTADFDRKLQECIERVRVSAAWRRRDTELLENWLRDRFP